MNAESSNRYKLLDSAFCFCSYFLKQIIPAKNKNGFAILVQKTGKL